MQNGEQFRWNYKLKNIEMCRKHFICALGYETPTFIEKIFRNHNNSNDLKTRKQFTLHSSEFVERLKII
jgi:hypothetical protein